VIGRILLGIAGLGLMAVGVMLVLRGGSLTSPVQIGIWLVGLEIISEALLMPLALGIGWLLARRLAPPARVPVQAGLVVAGVLSVVAIPVLFGPGVPNNPTVLPLDYWRNLVLVLLVVAVMTAVAVVVRVRRAGQLRNDRNGLPATDQDSASR
jgi:hypothetical protein